MFVKNGKKWLDYDMVHPTKVMITTRCRCCFFSNNISFPLVGTVVAVRSDLETRVLVKEDAHGWRDYSVENDYNGKYLYSHLDIMYVISTCLMEVQSK